MLISDCLGGFVLIICIISEDILLLCKEMQKNKVSIVKITQCDQFCL